MRPPFGAMDDQGRWFDGTDWRKMPMSAATGLVAVEHQMLMVLEVLSGHEAAGCHTEGVFKCPRCRRMHFIPDTYDLLCDGCEAIVATHPRATEEQRAGCAAWAERRRAHYTHPDILERVALRDRLMLPVAPVRVRCSRRKPRPRRQRTKRPR